MAQLDWSQCRALECKSDGEWVLKGTRLPGKVVFENLAGGMSTLEILRIFGVRVEAVTEVVQFVGESMNLEPVDREQVKVNLSVGHHIANFTPLLCVLVGWQFGEAYAWLKPAAAIVGLFAAGYSLFSFFRMADR